MKLSVCYTDSTTYIIYLVYIFNGNIKGLDNTEFIVILYSIASS